MRSVFYVCNNQDVCGYDGESSFKTVVMFKMDLKNYIRNYNRPKA
jgi:hypothetical protein